MPEFEQQGSLRNMAMEALVESCWKNGYEYAVQIVREWRSNKIPTSMDKLRQFVAYIKEDLDPRIPRRLATKFYNQFLGECCWKYERIVMEILMQVIMDKKMIGLKLPGRILENLNFDELNRIRGVVELELEIPMSHVAGLHLGDMIKFTHQRRCTDSDLELIGKNCPRLEYLDVSRSNRVTDVGLRALGPCINLNTVVLSRCPVSPSGINDLLSANKEIKNLSAWSNSLSEDCAEGFDCFSRSDSTVYPSIESFHITLHESDDNPRDSYLRAIVVKFPNLRSIRILGYLAEDLSVLRSLGKLLKVELYCELGFTWDNFERGLRSVGDKVSRLRLNFSKYRPPMQSQLNAVHEFCSNLECLNIRCQVRDDSEILSIPPFKKLKYLRFVNPDFSESVSYGTTISGLSLALGQLVELEELQLVKVMVNMGTIESLFDRKKYPNLNSVLLNELPLQYYDDYDIERIRQMEIDDCAISIEPTFRCISCQSLT